MKGSFWQCAFFLSFFNFQLKRVKGLNFSWMGNGYTSILGSIWQRAFFFCFFNFQVQLKKVKSILESNFATGRQFLTVCSNIIIYVKIQFEIKAALLPSTVKYVWVNSAGFICFSCQDNNVAIVPVLNST